MQLGFRFENSDEAWHKVQEEWQEFLAVVETESKEAEAADWLFAILVFLKTLDHALISLLQIATRKFSHRWRAMEVKCLKSGQKLENLSQEQWHKLWQDVKMAVDG